MFAIWSAATNVKNDLTTQMKKQKTGSIFDDFSKRNVKNGHEEKILQDNDKNLVPEERNVQIERLNEQLKSELASFGKEKSELESKIQNCENLHKENQNAAAAIESPKSENVQMKAEDVIRQRAYGEKRSPKTFGGYSNQISLWRFGLKKKEYIRN